MILDATTKSIQFVLGAAATTNELPCVTSWADITTSTFTPGSTDTQSNDMTAVTIVAAPASSTQRQVKTISIYNADTVAAEVTVGFNNNSTIRTLVDLTLQPGQTLQFAENAWTAIDSNGNILQASQSDAAGTDTEIQFNDGGSELGGDPNLTWQTSNQIMTLSGANANIQLAGDSGIPNSPPNGYLSFFSRSVANRFLAAQIGPSGLTSTLQPILARNKVGYWNPAGNSNAVPGVFGVAALSTQGTATARTVAVTNLGTRMRRMGYVSAATAGDLTEARSPAAQFSCGSGGNDGSGFFLVIRWMQSTAGAVAGERNFVGILNSTAAATNVDPSTLINCIGVAQLATDATQLYLVSGGSTAQTPSPLGATNFPASNSSTTPYELAIFAPNSIANTFYYQVTNIISGALATGTLTGGAIVIPQNNTLLAPRLWSCNNATAAAVAFDLCSIYIETDN